MKPRCTYACSRRRKVATGEFYQKHELCVSFLCNTILYPPEYDRFSPYKFEVDNIYVLRLGEEIPDQRVESLVTRRVVPGAQTLQLERLAAAVNRALVYRVYDSSTGRQWGARTRLTDTRYPFPGRSVRYEPYYE